MKNTSEAHEKNWTDRARQYLWVLSVPALAILMSFLLTSALLLLFDASPMEAFPALVRGAFGGKYAISETIAITTPLLLIALGICVAQTSSNFNIGAEGQLYMGALGAALVSIYLPANTPILFTIPIIIVAGTFFGMIWALLPAVMKAYYGVSEIVMTVMMNEIAEGFVSFLVGGPLKDPTTPIQQTVRFGQNWVFPALIPRTKIHLGIVLAAILVVVIWVYLEKTTVGFQVKAVGKSPKAATYAGMPVKRVVIMALLFSGGLAGLAGASEVVGVYSRLIDNFSIGYGYTAIVVSLLGKRNPLKIAISALLFSALFTGANAMQRAVGTPAALAEIIQAGTVFFWIMSEYYVSRIKKRFTRVRPCDEDLAQDKDLFA